MEDVGVREKDIIFKDDVLEWINEDGKIDEISFCDAGCGVGSLSLPLASISILEPNLISSKFPFR